MIAHIAPHINPFIIFIAAIFTGNILMANFLGTCSFIAISKDVKAANGLGIAVVIVIFITAILSYICYYYILIPLHAGYLNLIVFIILIAAVVQILEMVIERLSPTLYMALGIYLPLITVNCAVLGVGIFMLLRNYNFPQAILYSLGAGIGWWMVIIFLAGMRHKINKSPVPKALVGPGITVITIGMMAMGFAAFTNILPIQ